MQVLDGSAVPPSTAHIQTLFQALIDAYPADNWWPCNITGILCQDHVDREPVAASQFLDGVPVLSEDQQRRRGLAQPLQPSDQELKLNVYQLLPVLFNKAQFVSVQAVLVQGHQLRHYQRWNYNGMQGLLHDLWLTYTTSNVTTSELLRKCTHVLAPHFWCMCAFMCSCSRTLNLIKLMCVCVCVHACVSVLNWTKSNWVQLLGYCQCRCVYSCAKWIKLI